MDNRDKLVNIIMDAGMNSRPAYYSGYGATTDNLNSKHLFAIQKGIRENFGEEAAKAFANMVNNIKVLSATVFLQELYSLQNNEWKVIEKKKEASDICVDDAGSALGTFGMLMGGRERPDATATIRRDFIRSNGLVNENDRSAYDEVYGHRIYR